MANPKYADLPGIAYDQPDLYETNDLPEVDQNYDFTSDQSESVERLHISLNDAYGKFKDKSLESGRVDFSDRITKGRQQRGYDVQTGSWEVVGVGEKETPLQKYQRLLCEVSELMEEVVQLKGTVTDEARQEQTSAVLLATQVEELQKQLAGVKLEELLGSEVITNLSDPHGTLQKKLLAQLEALKQAKPKDGAVGSKGKTSGEGSVYELYHRPTQAQLFENSKAAELEKRLHRLEVVVGATPEKLSSLSAETNHKSLIGAVSVLDAKSSLLDPAQLDHVEVRLVNLMQKLNQISEKKSVIEDAEKQSKVAELYDMMKKSEAMASSFPEVLERMAALRELHEQALQFNKALVQMEAAQHQVSVNQQSHEKLLKELQQNFARDIEAMTKNMSSLNARIAALKK